MTNPALQTDRYELTMLSSFVANGTADTPAVFEAFTRRLPQGRRYGILAGIGRIADQLAHFSYTDDDLAWLINEGALTPAAADWLRGRTPTATIRTYREGDTYFPGSPVVQVEGPLGECILYETLILSALNYDSAVAAAAARMVTAAEGRPIIEMGSRRAHEDAAVAAARAAYIAGFASTSNLAAGRAHGIPTVGTAAHAFTLAHPTELDAFTAQIAAHGTNTTLLVDTYNTANGIRNAVTAANNAGATGPGAIRLDSGDLDVEARAARTLLDSLGATNTRITVTSDLDEYVMTALRDAPIDGYGAGTRVVTGSGHPTAGFVYKLVAIADQPDGSYRPVAKNASGKKSAGGRKTVTRDYTNGILTAETYTASTSATVPPLPDSSPQHVLVDAGKVVGQSSTTDARNTCQNALAALPRTVRDVSAGTAYLTVTDTPTEKE